MRADSAVLIPVKSFDLAKGRLADALDRDQRRRLARTLAAGVVAATGDLDSFVVCDNPDVEDWARSIGSDVLRINEPGLNRSLTRAIEMTAERGYRRAVISHADLPLAADLTWLTAGDADTDVIIVPDRHGTGTNVIALPVERPQRFRLQYGSDSCHRHRAEADRLGWSVEVVTDRRLAWDLDTPEDLAELTRHHPDLFAVLPRAQGSP